MRKFKKSITYDVIILCICLPIFFGFVWYVIEGKAVIALTKSTNPEFKDIKDL
jgi:hypothetical protein